MLIVFLIATGVFLFSLAGLHQRGILSQSAVTWTSVLSLLSGSAGLALWIRKGGRAIEANETFYGSLILIPSAWLLLALLVDGSLRGEGGTLWSILLIVEIVGSGIVFALRNQRLGCEERRRQAFQSLTDEIASGELLDHAGVMVWLDRHWPAPMNDADLHESRDEHAVAGRAGDYPVLIDVEPHGRADDPSTVPPRALVLLAARLPVRFANSPTAADLRASLARHSFELECCGDAGLIARATPTGCAGIQADPPQLEALPEVADQLAYAVANSGSIALSVRLRQQR